VALAQNYVKWAELVPTITRVSYRIFGIGRDFLTTKLLNDIYIYIYIYILAILLCFFFIYYYLFFISKSTAEGQTLAKGSTIY